MWDYSSQTNSFAGGKFNVSVYDDAKKKEKDLRHRLTSVWIQLTKRVADNVKGNIGILFLAARS